MGTSLIISLRILIAGANPTSVTDVLAVTLNLQVITLESNAECQILLV
jgi:hypothetical protein